MPSPCRDGPRREQLLYLSGGKSIQFQLACWHILVVISPGQLYITQAVLASTFAKGCCAQSSTGWSGPSAQCLEQAACLLVSPPEVFPHCAWPKARALVSKEGCRAGGLGETTHLHLLHQSSGRLLQVLGNLLQLGLGKSCLLHLGRTTARDVPHSSLLQQIFLFFVHGY